MNTTTNEVVSVNDRIAAMREAMKNLESERRATLPRIDTEQLAKVCAFESSTDASEDLRKEVSEIRKNTNLDWFDKDQIAAAKIEHRRTINTDESKRELAARIMAAQLTSVRYTHRKDGRLGVSVRGMV